ncbi:membrane integrity-associated transporter subunit PqiC [Magnetovirga frankeli]|uniref:PqiC family protein n=1 Tax=Magnetovirga frankeli TaxID=947516 RepID=UPI001AF6B686|nr:membrane integrity-associated transporter subunit PqiC [gamma proteobacterium SS-5]
MKNNYLFFANRSSPWSVGVLALIQALALTGCMAGANTRFYSFASVRPSEMVPVAAARRSGVWVVGPVKLYEEIDRPQLVIRRSVSQVEISELDQWAVSLEQGISRLLIEALGTQFPGRQLAAFPWTGREPVALRISPEVRQLSVTPGGEMVLTLVWALYDPKGDRLNRLEPQSYRQAAAADIGPEQLVQGYRELLLQAVRDLAPRLKPYA